MAAVVRLVRWLVMLCAILAADVPSAIAFTLSDGAECAAEDCKGDEPGADCQTDCGLCPFCPIRITNDPMVAPHVAPMLATSLVTSFVSPVSDPAERDIFHPPLAA